MTAVASLCTVLLGMLFAWSASAKLRRPAATGDAFEQMGVPLPRVMARLVPIIELGVSFMLMVAPRTGAIIAWALLILFTMVLLPHAIAAGWGPHNSSKMAAPVTCACFGSASTAPISWVEIGRNVILLAATITAGLGGTDTLRSGLEAVDLPSIVTFSMLGLMSIVALQLLVLKRDIGSVWRTQLAGEATTPPLSREGSTRP